MTRDEAIRQIRAALKRRSGKDWSVTGGKGTAWGWLKINAPPRRCTWQWVQTKTPTPPAPGAQYRGVPCITPTYMVEPGSSDAILSPEDDPWARQAAEKGYPVVYCWEVEQPEEKYGHMSPADRVELALLLRLSRPVHHQGESIAASGDHYLEYVDRAEGKEPSVCGSQYWD